MLRRDARSGFLVLALVAGLLAACASPSAPGVKVRSLVTTVGLGLVRSPNQRIELPPLPALENLPLPGFEMAPFAAAVPLCGKAGPYDFPAVSATANVTGRPALGAYLWRYRVEIKDPKRAKEFMPLSVLARGEAWEGFGVRAIVAASDDPVEAATTAATQDLKRETFWYTTGDFPGLGYTPTTFFRGDIMRVQPASYLDTPRTTRDAEEGMSLLLTSWGEGDLSKRDEMRAWLLVYGPPLELIRFPIFVGQQVGVDLHRVHGRPPRAPAAPDLDRFDPGYEGIHTAPGVDPVRPEIVPFRPSVGQAVNGAVLGAVADPAALIADPTLVTKYGELGPKWVFVLTGRVKGHLQVDACGERVDSWLVDGDLTYGPDGQISTVDYDYGIATQLGGMLVYERLAIPAGDPAVIVTASMGKIKPF